MGKVLNFERDSEYYLKISDKKYEKGDIAGSISAIRYAVKYANSGEEFGDSVLALAQTYSEIDRFDLSNEAYYHLLDLEMCLPDCYMGLIQNSLSMGQTEVADYYFSKLGDVVEELSSENINDYFSVIGNNLVDNIKESMRPNREGYELVYPKKIDYVERANQMIELDAIDEAIELLEQVPQNNHDYIEARNELAFCYIVNNKFQEGIDSCDEVLQSRKDDVFAWCNKIIALKGLKDKEGIEKVLKNIVNLQPKTDGEIIKLATTMCEIGDHQLAVKYLKDAIAIKPYFDMFKILLGIAYINLGELERASSVFSDILMINKKNQIARYYMKYISGLKKDKEVGQYKQPTLVYIPQIPYLEVATRMTKVKELCEKSDMRFLEDEDAVEWELVDWLFSTDEVELQRDFMFACVSKHLPGGEDFAEGVLLMNNIHKIIKGLIIQDLALYMAEVVSVVLDGRFKSIELDYPEDYLEIDPDYRYAYAVAISLIVLVDESLIETLKMSAEILFAIAKAKEIKFDSVMALAMLLVVGTDLSQDDLQYICKFFKVDFEVVNKYRDMLFGDDIKA